MEAVVLIVVAGLVLFGLYRMMRRGRRRSEAGLRREGASDGANGDERGDLGLGIKITVHTNPETERARQVFKDATAASVQDPGKAVRLFRKARKQAALSGMDHGIDVFLRLPRYLQDAGRSEEGWKEFRNLLANGYPNMQEGDRARHRMQSAIYDKMRLFLQREKRFSSAVLFGALSIVYGIKAVLTERPDDGYLRSLQDLGPSSDAGRRFAEKNRSGWERRRREGRQMDLKDAEFLRRQEYLDEHLTKLLRRADLLDRQGESLAVLCEWANAQPDADDNDYEDRFKQALGLDPQLSGLRERDRLARW